jgi:hypothetical protein
MSTFNLRSFLKKKAANEDGPTESRLRDQKSPNGEPNEISEIQLEDSRSDGEGLNTEQRLEKARQGSPDSITEAQMDKSNSKLVDHRNEAASEGNLPKLEEQRLSGESTPEKEIQEEEKYDAASETDKKLEFPIVKGKDGLKTASLTKTQADFDDIEDPDDFNDDYPINLQQEDQDLDSVFGDYPIDLDEDDEGLMNRIDKMTDDIDDESFSDEEMEDFIDPSPAEFSVDDVSKADVGGTSVKQYTVSFNPAAFDSSSEARNDAGIWFQETFPEIPVAHLDEIIIDLDQGKAILSTPGERNVKLPTEVKGEPIL